MQKNVKDVVVIGGGVVGTSIFRKLSFYDLHIALVEKEPDFCEGTSKANSGIVHTGFDAPVDSVEAACLQRSRRLWPKLVEQLKIPFVPCGAIMVATNEEEKNIIESKYIPNAEKNGVEVQWLTKSKLLEDNPAITNEVIGGLLIPGESICDPFTVTRAYGELAVLNGADVYFGNAVLGIEEIPEGFEITLENNRTLQTKYIVNAAGLYSDEIARLIGDDSFKISPRKGQFIITEERIDISNIILPVPTKTSKGTLVSPIVFGGFLLGPTAEDQEDKEDRSTTDNGVKQVYIGCEKLVPSARNYRSIRQFAGLRAVCSTGDFVIRPSRVNPHMVHAAGIRSTGLSASPGIAELVIEKLIGAGIQLSEKANPTKEIPNLFNDSEDVGGEVICLCRSITKGEILNCLKGPVPPTTIDGIKRRTGAMLGECQGNCCLPKILDMMVQNKLDGSKMPIKGIQNSYISVERER